MQVLCCLEVIDICTIRMNLIPSQPYQHMFNTRYHDEECTLDKIYTKQEISHELINTMSSLHNKI